MPKKQHYDAKKISTIFDNYNEWSRLEGTAYKRFLRELHMRELRKHVKKNMEVLDLGCGPGRFSLEMLKLGARVTLADISKKQLSLAKRKIVRAGLQDGVRAYKKVDATDMPEIKSSSFDFVLAYGAVLSFIVDKNNEALKEIRRVLKPKGKLLVEVVSQYGVFRECLVEGRARHWRNPEEEGYWRVIETGIQPWGKYWAVKFYTGEELRELLESHGFKVRDLFTIPSISYSHKGGVERLMRDKKALETLFQVEERLRSKSGIIDAGQYICAVAAKK